jgi:putative component of toxin-antitoxin plasmid stabilization module
VIYKLHFVMFVLKQTDRFLKWQRKLKDERAAALVAARLLRLSNGLFGSDDDA